MHCSTLAMFKSFAGGTKSGFHPCSVTHYLKAVFPYFGEIVVVNIALRKMAVDIGTSRNRTIDKYGGDVDACAAKETGITYAVFVVAYIRFTAEFCVNCSAKACLDDEIH